MHACLQLRVKIAKQQAAKEQKLRKKNLTKYIPNAAYAIYRVLQSMSETPAVSSLATPSLLTSQPFCEMAALYAKLALPMSKNLP